MITRMRCGFRTSAALLRSASSKTKPRGAGGAVFGDPRNDDILIYMRKHGMEKGALVPRSEAVVSVFDSGFLLGDAVWEGLRLYNGKWFQLHPHLKRLYEACKFMDIDIGISPTELKIELNNLVAANRFKNDVHARLCVSRGEKYTPYQGPATNIGPPTIVCIAEHKPKIPVSGGLRLHTVHVRRGYADSQDQKLNSHSKINCITACIAASKAGFDEALMLDPHGQVATCNSTHFFIVKDGEVYTSSGSYCIPGITRGTILTLCRENGIPCHEKEFSLFEVYGADEAFVTGTFQGITPVGEVDGRRIGEGLVDCPSWLSKGGNDMLPDGVRHDIPGPMVQRLQRLYLQKVVDECGGF